MRINTPRLLDPVRAVLRRKHYALRTEEAYVSWVKRYVLFHQKRHPRELGLPEVEAFLTDLAVAQQVAASTQNQALSALLFLYAEVLEQPLAGRVAAVRAKQPERLLTVMTRDEVVRVLGALIGVRLLLDKLAVWQWAAADRAHAAAGQRRGFRPASGDRSPHAVLQPASTSAETVAPALWQSSVPAGASSLPVISGLTEMIP